MTGLAAITAGDCGGHPHVTKTAGLIQVSDRLFVLLQKRLAETAPSKPQRAGLQKHALAQSIRIEVLVPLELDADQLLPWPAADGILYRPLVVLRRELAKRHIHVRVSFEEAFGNAGLHRLHADFRAGVDLESRLGALYLGIVIERSQIDRSSETILVLIFFFNSIEPLARERLGDLPPAADKTDAPAGCANDR